MECAQYSNIIIVSVSADIKTENIKYDWPELLSGIASVKREGHTLMH